MALQFLASHRVDDGACRARALELLEKGYKRLLGFECSKKGYEWFGSDPGHEALTAYGLMEFTDMAKVFAVDPAMIARTRDWLLAKRDGKGGFTRREAGFHAWSCSPEATNAYIAWALLESGASGLEKEVACVRESARRSEDSYLLALAANVLEDAKDGEAGEALDRLAKKQAKDGEVQGAVTSITCSAGESLAIETTSLAVLAWLRSPAHTESCERAMRWILERAKDGRFGATQSTVLALKAIVAFDAAHASRGKAGKLRLLVDGKCVEESAFAAEATAPIVLGKLGSALSPGEHDVALELEDGSPMPFSLIVKYRSRTRESCPSCKVSLSTELASTEIREGEPVDLSVHLANKEKEAIPMTVAIVALPGGLEARADQLGELVKQGKIDFFETRGREVILYFRGLAAREQRSLALSLVAAIPGSYEGAASCAYLYYQDEAKRWVEPLRARILAAME